MNSLFSVSNETETGKASPWWLAMIGGITAFVVGLLFLISPGMTLLVLVQFLGTYWLITGILSLVSLCIDSTQWGLKLVSSVLGILAGLVVLRDPLWSTVLIPSVLAVIVAIESLIMGVSQFILAIRGGGFGLAVLAILNIIFGIVLLSNPLFGVYALAIILGITAVVGGGFIAIRAFVSRPRTTRSQQAGIQQPA